MATRRALTLKTDRTFGVNNPIKDSNHGNVFSMSRDSIDKYKSRLYTVIFTNPGDRVMMPTFGCRIQELLFEPMNDRTFSALRKEINRAALTWVPDITIQEIEFGDKDEDLENNRINITIKFSLKVDASITDQLNIEMSL